MPRAAKGEIRRHGNGRWSARIRLRGERVEVDLGFVDRAAAAERATLLATLAAHLAPSTHDEQNRNLLAHAGTVDGRSWAKVVAAADDLATGRRLPVAKPASVETVATFAERWTSGELARLYPDHVRQKATAKQDGRHFRRSIVPVIGPVPIAAVTLAHAEEVLAHLPRALSPSSRRHVAQALRRLLTLATYPAKLRPDNPIPAGWLPKLGQKKAREALYPEEDAVLLGCLDVPLVRRLAYGLCTREGFRVAEVARLEWADVDLDRGFVRLDRNKTKDPRAWDLDPGTTNALRTLRVMTPGVRRVLDVGERLNRSHLAEWLRDDLRVAGVRRPELFRQTSERIRMRAHDLRATFVTIALAAGKSETWISDRTGHKSSAMIRTYHRASRRYAAGDLVALTPLGLALPELRLPQDCPTANAPNGGGSGSAGKKPKQTTIVKDVGRMLSNHPVAGSNPAGRTENAAETANDVGRERPESPGCGWLGAIRGANDGWAVAA